MNLRAEINVLLADLFRWRPGRQGTGYRKMLLARSKLPFGAGFDLWIIDYPPGSYVRPHYDPVEGKRHHRLNVLLTGSMRAFVRYPNGKAARGGRFNLFRPDVELHTVTASKTRRVVLSLGWATPLRRPTVKP